MGRLYIFKIIILGSVFFQSSLSLAGISCSELFDIQGSSSRNLKSIDDFLEAHGFKRIDPDQLTPTAFSPKDIISKQMLPFVSLKRLKITEAQRKILLNQMQVGDKIIVTELGITIWPRDKAESWVALADTLAFSGDINSVKYVSAIFWLKTKEVDSFSPTWVEWFKEYSRDAINGQNGSEKNSSTREIYRPITWDPGRDINNGQKAVDILKELSRLTLVDHLIIFNKGRFEKLKEVIPGEQFLISLARTPDIIRLISPN